MNKFEINHAILQLQNQYNSLNWTYHDYAVGDKTEKMYKWPGNPDDKIIICIHKSNGIQEFFHRHDFFYFNYTYRGSYNSLSYQYNNQITISEHELYAGQPFAGHALFAHDDNETIIIGILIQKDTFFQSFLSLFSANNKLFHFFLTPTTNTHSDEFLHFKIEDNCMIQNLIEMMVVEYANKTSDTPEMMKPLVLAFLMQIAREYKKISPVVAVKKVSDSILHYISEHPSTVSLNNIAAKFSYHPNYISALLHKETGKSFSQILLEQRMHRAVILLKSTNLSIAEIALMLGYSNSSNFYKAFRAFHHVSPREYD